MVLLAVDPAEMMGELEACHQHFPMEHSSVAQQVLPAVEDRPCNPMGALEVWVDPYHSEVPYLVAYSSMVGYQQALEEVVL